MNRIVISTRRDDGGGNVKKWQTRVYREGCHQITDLIDESTAKVFIFFVRGEKFPFTTCIQIDLTTQESIRRSCCSSMSLAPSIHVKPHSQSDSTREFGLSFWTMLTHREMLRWLCPTWSNRENKNSSSPLVLWAIWHILCNRRDIVTSYPDCPTTQTVGCF